MSRPELVTVQFEFRIRYEWKLPSLGIMLVLLLLLPVLVGALESSSLLLELAQLAAQEGATSQLTLCVEQLRQLHSAWQANEGWALKALDASGSGFNNFMLANSLWLGNRHTCRALNEPLLQDFTRNHQQLLREQAPFKHAYSVAYLRTNSSWQLTSRMKQRQLLHVGLCVPHSCDPQQLEQLLRQSLKPARVKGSWEQRMDLQLELVYAKRPELSAAFFTRPAVRWMILLLVGSILLPLLARSGCFPGSRILGCFDVAANWRRLWQLPSEGSQEIAVINGLRVCSAFVLLGLHVICYQFVSVSHSANLIETLVTVMIYIHLPAALEVFFSISGFLTVSHFMHNVPLQRSIASESLPGVARRFVKQVVQRYLRLAPLQCIVILLTVVSFNYHREASVFDFVEPMDKLCEQHWWRNLLFVQNLYPVTEMCCNWTWSLGCDLQMYIMAMMMLYLYTRHPKLVKHSVWLFLVGNMVHSVLVLIYLDAPNTMDDMFTLFDWLYTSPFVRMLTYLVGGLYGYAHVHSLEAPFGAIFSTKVAQCAWAGFSLWLVGQLKNFQLASPSAIGGAFAIFRFLGSAAIANLIFSSFRLDGSYSVTRRIIRFLESNWFQRLSRITYAIYLLNPMVMLHVYYSFSDEIFPDGIILLYLCVSHLVIVTLLAIPLTLLFELPLNRLTTQLFASNTIKSE